MEPKPLTKNELDLIEGNECAGLDLTSTRIKQLLAAEQYWREAVKNAQAYSCEDGRYRCVFCGVVMAINTTTVAEHKPDCAWLLAHQ